MPFLEKDQVEEIWEKCGMKFRVKEFYNSCIGRGLEMKENSFVGKFKKILIEYGVEDRVSLPPEQTPGVHKHWWKRF